MADASRATSSDIANPVTTVSVRTMAFVLSLATTLIRASRQLFDPWRSLALPALPSA